MTDNQLSLAYQAIMCKSQSAEYGGRVGLDTSDSRIVTFNFTLRIGRLGGQCDMPESASRRIMPNSNRSSEHMTGWF